MVETPSTFDTYYDARQIVVADPEGNVFRVTYQR